MGRPQQVRLRRLPRGVFQGSCRKNHAASLTFSRSGLSGLRGLDHTT